jgi:formylglycine-generating enzyme
VQPCAHTPRAGSTSPTGDPLFDEEVCVPGGAFTLGNSEVLGVTELDAIPEQVAVVEPFLLDRYELTVARYRGALGAGFVSPNNTPTVNDGPLALDSTDLNDPALCTFSISPLGREHMPLNCINWYAARELCRFLGGDLPSHIEWEYAASAANGSAMDRTYPWGEEQPDCCKTAWGRGLFSAECQGTSTCQGTGPVAVDAEPWASNDVTPLGIVGMGGNVSEWGIDAVELYTSPCWWQHPLRGVGCEQQEPRFRGIRGGGWPVASNFTRAAVPAAYPPGMANGAIGVRCARKDGP